MITFPNAKINIGLRVTGKRSDGYHDLETVFFPVGWSDALEIASSEELNFSMSGIRITGTPESNLVMKAYSLLKEKYDLPPLRIHLHKQIPFGAGLGGGSSDGTFMLSMLNRTFDLKISDEKLIEFAALLGSDCPFFVYNSPVLATGRGEIMQKINLSLKGLSILIVKPLVEVSTADAFRYVVPEKPETSLADLILTPVVKWKEVIENQFETSVFLQYPEIENIKNLLYRKGALYASLSGSGSCVFGLFIELPEDLERLFSPTCLTFTQQF